MVYHFIIKSGILMWRFHSYGPFTVCYLVHIFQDKKEEKKKI